MTTYSFVDESGETRLRGTLDPAPGGAPSVKWVDLGVVTAAALAVSGARTLYTTGAGELVSAIRFGDAVTPLDTNVWSIIFDLAGWHSDAGSGFYGQVSGPSFSISDAGGNGIWGSAGFNSSANYMPHVSPPLLTGALVATLDCFGESTLGTTPGWQANHVYASTAAIIAAGHGWDFAGGSGGTSGGSTPDFAGNIGGTVVDGGVTWVDEGAVPTAGSVHAYIEVVTPAVA